MKKILFLLCMMVGSVYAQSNTCSTTTGVTTCNYTINDDGYAIVPIPFGFPFYGKLFTHSLFFDNGVVSFYSPTNIDDPMRTGGQNFYAEPLSNNIGSQFYYSIMPLWSDLYNYSGRYFTETDGQGFLRYNWENISQFGYPDRLNTFGLEIRPTGFIGVNYQQINIQEYPITAGTVGNASLGEWTQYNYYDGSQQLGLNIPGWSTESTGAYDPCITDPLSSPSCSGYQQAYHDQQCSINPLYAVTCPGYQAAYYTQQCSLNPLYDTGCPGYASAYLDYQCSLDPLYSTTCAGYQQAYFDQQCSLDPLYNNSCPGYAEAFALKNIVNQPVPNQEAAVASVVEPKPAATSPAQPVQIVSIAPTAPAVVEVKPQETKTETPAASSADENKPKTARQQLAERRQAAARAAAVEKAKNAEKEMETATSMEAQIAVQNVVIQAMGFTPGFDAYNVRMPDGVGYRPFTVYDNQKNVDNARLMRGLTGGSDRVHAEMVDEQYRR